MDAQSTLNRQILCNELDFFAQKHPEQKLTADTIKSFISGTEACFERSNGAGHITGSAWLINPGGDKALLTLHHKLKRWMQTGGHADGDSDVLRVALREAEEESGISGIRPLMREIFDIDIHPIPANPHKGEGAHYHYDIRYLLQAPHEQFRISHESDDLAWWSQQDFQQRSSELDEAALRMASRYFGTNWEI